MTIIKRADLGRPLTWDELDNNFAQVDSLVTTASTAVETATTQAQAASGFAMQASQSSQDAQTAAASAGSAAEAAVAGIYSDFASNDAGKGASLVETKDGESVQNKFDKSRVTANTVVIGVGAAPNVTSDDLVAVGTNAAPSIVGARNCIAIGKGSMLTNVVGRHNIAIGLEALRTVNGLSTSSIEGSRNIGIGGNAGRFISTGNRNIILGRDAGHNLTTATNMIVMGNGSEMGDGPNTLDPGVIENQTPLSPSSSIMIGTESGKYFNAANAVGIGYQALLNNKTDTGIVGIGSSAFLSHQSDLSYWGTTQLNVSVNCTYSQTGSTTITVNSVAHGLTSGFRVWLRFTTGANADTTFMDDNWFIVTVLDANNFTITSPVSTTASGNASYSRIATTTNYTTLTGGCVGIGREVGNGVSNYRSTAVGDRAGALGLGTENVAIGFQVHNLAVPGSGNTAVGAYSQAASASACTANTSLGVLTLNVLNAAANNTAVGAQSQRLNVSGANNTSVGINSLRNLTTGTTNTAVGAEALRLDQSGASHNYSNSTGIGYQAYVSGSNQVQLGNSATTTYVYGTVQARSDERDKADVEDIPDDIAVAFVRGLSSKFYRWDYRDDYISIDDEGNVSAAEKDGSKKRSRLHAGYLAQQVKALMDELGIDFGMYQDHLIEGGCDVKTVGYDQAIPLISKALSVAFDRLDDIEERMKSLEAK